MHIVIWQHLIQKRVNDFFLVHHCMTLNLNSTSTFDWTTKEILIKRQQV